MGERDEQRPAAERPASALEAFLAWPFAAATQVVQANLRLFESLTPQATKAASRDSQSAHPSHGPPRIRSLLNSHRCDCGIFRSAPMDLQPSSVRPMRCMVRPLPISHRATAWLRRCATAACRACFVTDWRSATPETRYFTIDNYLADLNVAVDELGPPVDLVGLCQGGWLALVYAARFPNKVRRLVLVGAPIDIAAAESQLSHFVADMPFDHVRRIRAVGRGHRAWRANAQIVGHLGAGGGGFAKSARRSTRRSDAN